MSAVKITLQNGAAIELEDDHSSAKALNKLAVSALRELFNTPLKRASGFEAAPATPAPDRD